MSQLPIDASSSVVALLLVGFYATSRFNMPPAARSQTSRFQYVGSCVCYVLSSAGLFFLLTWLLIKNPQALAFLQFGASTALSNDVTQLAAPLIVALVMTTLLPSFPMLRDVDAALLRIFHRMGSIPIAAAEWSKRMNKGEFVISSHLLKELGKHIGDSSVLADDMVDELRTDPSVDSARYRFTRNLAVYVSLSNLDSQTRFTETYPEEAAAFEKTIASFFAQSTGFFALTKRLSLQELDPVPEPIKNAREGYKSLCHDVYEEIRLMLARVLLYSSNGQHEVGRRLAGLGFVIQYPQQIRIPTNLLVSNAGGVMALFAVVTLLATGNGVTIGQALIIGCLVAVNHSVGAVAAVVPKQLWGFAKVNDADGRPIAAYAVSALCTFTVCLPIMLGFWLLRPELSLPPIPFSAQCKWLLLPVAMAAALAFECDDYVAVNKVPAWLQWIEGAALAVVMAFAGFVAVQWIYQSLGTAIPPRVLLPILLSASLGFLFGATIPSGYRRILRQIHAERGGDLTLPPSSVGATNSAISNEPMKSKPRCWRHNSPVAPSALVRTVSEQALGSGRPASDPPRRIGGGRHRLT